jgi:hypothetical protein
MKDINWTSFSLVKWEGDPPVPEPADPTTHPDCREVIRVRFEGAQEILETWRNPNAAN